MWKKNLNIFWICGFILICIFISSKTVLAISCTMTAEPDFGASPLTVKFDISLNAGHLSSFMALWDFDDGNTSQLPYPFFNSHTYTSAGTYTPSYTITSDQGNCECSTSVTVNAYEQKPPEVTLKATPVSGTAPLEVMFNPSVTNGTEPYTFSYSFGDEKIADENEVATNGSILHIYQEAGNYTATVTVTDAENFSAASSSEITVEPPEKMKVFLESDAAEGMVPFRIQLSAKVNNGTEPYKYVWIIDDRQTTSQIRSKYFYTFQQPGNHSVYLKVTDSIGSTAVSNSLNITAMLPIAIELETKNISGFAPLAASFFVNILKGEPPFEVDYDFGDGFSSTGMITRTSHEYTLPGSYKAAVSVTDGHGSKTEKSILVTVIDTLDDKLIETSLAAVSTVTQAARDPESLSQLISSGNTIVQHALEPLHNAPDEIKNNVQSVIEEQTESLVTNVNNRLRTFEKQGTADSQDAQSIIFELKQLISETTKKDVPFTTKSINAIQSILESALRLGIKEILSASGLSENEIEEIRTDHEKAKTYFASHPDRLFDVLSISGLSIDVFYETDRNLMDSTAKEKGIQEDDLHTVQSAIPKVIDVAKNVKKNNETEKSASIVDLMIEMLNSQASGEEFTLNSDISPPYKAASTTEDGIVKSHSVDQLSGNLNIGFKQTNVGMSLNELSIGSSYLPNGIHKMADGSFLGINNNFNFRLYPAAADSLSVITQIINEFDMTPKFDKTGRLSVEFENGYLSLGMGWNIMNSTCVSNSNPLLKSLPKLGTTAGGISFSGTGGTDTAAYAYSVLVEYGDGSSQMMPPMIMAEEEMLPVLQSILPQSSIYIDRNTGVLSIDDWDLKPDYLFEPLTEIDYARIETNNGYIVGDLAFEFDDYNKDGMMDVKFFSSSPLGYQLLYTAVKNN